MMACVVRIENNYYYILVVPIFLKRDDLSIKIKIYITWCNNGNPGVYPTVIFTQLHKEYYYHFVHNLKKYRNNRNVDPEGIKDIYHINFIK